MVPLAGGVHVPALFQLTACNINSQFSMPSVRMMVFAELIYRLFCINWATHFLLTQVSRPFLFVHLFLPRPLAVACEDYYSPLFPTTLRKQYSPQQRYCFKLIALFNPAAVLCTILKRRPSGRGREREKMQYIPHGWRNWWIRHFASIVKWQYLVKNPWLGRFGDFSRY